MDSGLQLRDAGSVHSYAVNTTVPSSMEVCKKRHAAACPTVQLTLQLSLQRVKPRTLGRAAKQEVAISSMGKKANSIANVLHDLSIPKAKLWPKHWFRTGMRKWTRLSRTRMNAARKQLIAPQPLRKFNVASESCRSQQYTPMLDISGCAHMATHQCHAAARGMMPVQAWPWHNTLRGLVHVNVARL